MLDYAHMNNLSNSVFSDIDRDVVVIAVSYFDLYLSTRKRNTDGSLIRLVAMTSLYLAIKLHSTKKISPKLMSR